MAGHSCLTFEAVNSQLPRFNSQILKWFGSWELEFGRCCVFNVLLQLDFVTGLGETLGTLRQIDALLPGVLHDDGTCANQCGGSNVDGVPDGGVDTDEA